MPLLGPALPELTIDDFKVLGPEVGDVEVVPPCAPFTIDMYSQLIKLAIAPVEQGLINEVPIAALRAVLAAKKEVLGSNSLTAIVCPNNDHRRLG